MTEPKNPAEARRTSDEMAGETRGLVARARAIVEELRREREQNHFAPTIAKVMERKGTP